MKQLLTLLKKIKKDANTAIKMLKETEVSSSPDNAVEEQLEASTPIVEDLSVETPETLEDFKNEEITNTETEGSV